MNELVIYNNASFSLLKVLQRRVEREMAILMQLYGKHERQTSKLALSALILAKLSLGSHKKKSQKCNAGKTNLDHATYHYGYIPPDASF